MIDIVDSKTGERVARIDTRLSPMKTDRVDKIEFTLDHPRITAIKIVKEK